MIGYVTYLAVQDIVGSRALEARPEAPVIDDTPRRTALRPSGALFRQRLSLDLRRLADLIEPAPARTRIAGRM